MRYEKGIFCCPSILPSAMLTSTVGLFHFTGFRRPACTSAGDSVGGNLPIVSYSLAFHAATALRPITAAANNRLNRIKPQRRRSISHTSELCCANLWLSKRDMQIGRQWSGSFAGHPVTASGVKFF